MIAISTRNLALKITFKTMLFQLMMFYLKKLIFSFMLNANDII